LSRWHRGCTTGDVMAVRVGHVDRLAYQIVLAVVLSLAVAGGTVMAAADVGWPAVGPYGTQGAPRPDTSISAYVVQPGETLASICARMGVPMDALMRANGLQNPRQIYPGQRLTAPGGRVMVGVRHVLSAAESVRTLSRGSGASLATVSRANQLLLPTRLPIGWALWLPGDVSFRVVPPSAGGISAQAPRLAAAVTSGARLWDVLWLNPSPHYSGQEILVPDKDVGASLYRSR
jgi:LysM repeat protein